MSRGKKLVALALGQTVNPVESPKIHNETLREALLNDVIISDVYENVLIDSLDQLIDCDNLEEVAAEEASLFTPHLNELTDCDNLEEVADDDIDGISFVKNLNQLIHCDNLEEVTAEETGLTPHLNALTDCDNLEEVADEDINSISCVQSSNQLIHYDILEEVTAEETDLFTPHLNNLTDCDNLEEAEEQQLVEAVPNSETENQQTRKRKRSGKYDVNPSNWEKQRNKHLRLQGKDYFGAKKSTGDEKWHFTEPKEGRKLKESCQCKRSLKGNFKCRDFSEDERRQIFGDFWKLDSWESRKLFLKQVVQVVPVKTRTVPKDKINFTRFFSYIFKLNLKGDLVRVCKKFFLATLDLGEWSVQNWMNSGHGEEEEGERDALAPVSSGTRPRGRKQRDDLKLEYLKTFFNKLAKMESHYCRKRSSKLYLEPLWPSKNLVYLQYKKECSKDNKEAYSYPIFNKVFHQMNLSLYTPRKDQCDICTAHKNKNVTDEEHKQHVEKKNLAREAKERDKVAEKFVFTMDLQSVLLCPRIQASSLYYKMKLCVHNFTIFNLKSQEGYCFIWHEGEGKVCANEFATILFNFVESLNTNPGDDVILYSDGCTAQNRNATLSNAMLLLAEKKQVTITQKFLEKGHTQMECDSMHATIERALKNKEVHIPSGYISIIKNSKLSHPYKVFNLDHNYFKNFEVIKGYKTIRPGYKIGDPKVTDLKCLRYDPNGTIGYKLTHKENIDFLKLEGRNIKKKNNDLIVPPPLYSNPQKINPTKFRHLQDLKQFLPQDVHSFYDHLNHESD